MRGRVLLLTICLPALIVLQLKANVEPPTLKVTINGPAVGLLGSTVKFTASVSKTGNGGNGIYTYEWKVKYNGVENEEDETGNTCSYEIPDGDADAKEVTVVCTATDTGDSSITGPGEKQFWQVSIQIQSGGNAVPVNMPVLVGELVTLQGVIRPANAPITRTYWTLPESYNGLYKMIIKGTSFDPKNSYTAYSFTDITASDREGANVAFHFIFKQHNGSPDYPYIARAMYHADIDGVWLSNTCTISVSVPVTEFFNQEWGSIALRHNYASLDFPWGLFKGNGDDSCGIAFIHRHLGTPNGSLCIVPVATLYYSRSDVPQTHIHQDANAIDTDNIAVSHNAIFGDSPGNEIDTNYYLYTMRNDLFSTYVFYQSHKSASIWVPIAQVAWQWSAEAYPSASVWRCHVMRHPAPDYRKGVSTLPSWTHKLIP